MGLCRKSLGEFQLAWYGLVYMGMFFVVTPPMLAQSLGVGVARAPPKLFEMFPTGRGPLGQEEGVFENWTEAKQIPTTCKSCKIFKILILNYTAEISGTLVHFQFQSFFYLLGRYFSMPSYCCLRIIQARRTF
jgi:hypothetical protein